MKEAVVLIADTHINSKLGLCSPDVYSDDGDGYQLNLIQKWLWKTWLKCIDDIKDLTKGCEKKTVILNGDVVDLDTKFRSGQMISQNPATILKIADDVLEPMLKQSTSLFVIRGTEAHVGQSAWSEEAVAHRFRAVQDQETKQYSWWQLRAIIGGVKFDIAHHFSMGYLPWTFSNAAMRLVQETKFSYLEWEEEMPDVIVRAHQHRFCESGTTFSTRGVFLPCWQYNTAYLYRLGKANARPHIGAVVFICEDGDYTIHPLIYEPIRSNTWTKI